MKRFILRLSILLILAIVLFSCCGKKSDDMLSKSLFITPITDILDNPQKYEKQLITVEGEVSKSIGLFTKSAFTLTDKTGSVKVYCPSSMAPSDGETVKIKGQVHMVYRFKDYLFCYIKQQKNK
ncbi:MAG: hypothetical protein J6U22_01130 [Bacteroidaceae bacterium]|nr:hypothetical protein [Bacteroidaceae bacterium]